MCGIYGYVGDNCGAASIVLQNLKKLEYRGYDSWGVGAAKNGKIMVDKHTGKIGDAQTALPNTGMAVGHTRWATHGGVTMKNAHPHLDCSGQILIVHNGIIENYQEIRQHFKHSHTLISETDSELFAHLVEEYLEHKSFAEAVRSAFNKLEGLSAFVVANAATNEIVAIKTGSPLVVGLGKGENYIASDANCLLDKTREVVYLEDNQMAVLSKKNVDIRDVLSGKKAKYVVSKIDGQESIASKENYPHFMLKEIYEQPKALKNIDLNFEQRIKSLAMNIATYPKIYLVGCGSAYYVAQASSYVLSAIAHKDSEAIAGSEFANKEQFIDKNSLVIFFSQSGETIDITEPLKRMKSKGIKTVGVVNVFGSTLYRLADEKIWLETGPEICVLTTKAFTAMLGVMMLAAYHMANEFSEGKKKFLSATSHLEEILTKDYQESYINPVVSYLSKQANIYGIGKGVSFPIAMESALKVKEVSYIHMEGFASGELKHGVIALINQGTPCVVFAPHNETYKSVLSGAMEIKSRGGYIIGVSEDNNEIFNAHIPVIDDGVFTCLAQVIVAQLIGYRLAVLLNLDPDKPRNLAKSVTVV